MGKATLATNTEKQTASIIEYGGELDSDAKIQTMILINITAAAELKFVNVGMFFCFLKRIWERGQERDIPWTGLIIQRDIVQKIADGPQPWNRLVIDVLTRL